VQVFGGVQICPLAVAARSGGVYGTRFALSGAPPSDLAPLLSGLISALDQSKTNRLALFLDDWNEGAGSPAARTIASKRDGDDFEFEPRGTPIG
jgi:hypothetical protein